MIWVHLSPISKQDAREAGDQKHWEIELGLRGHVAWCILDCLSFWGWAELWKVLDQLSVFINQHCFLFVFGFRNCPHTDPNQAKQTQKPLYIQRNRPHLVGAKLLIVLWVQQREEEKNVRVQQCHRTRSERAVVSNVIDATKGIATCKHPQQTHRHSAKQVVSHMEPMDFERSQHTAADPYGDAEEE